MYQTVKEHPYCEFATSRPDTLFYHKTKYFLDKTVFALSASCESASGDEAMAMSRQESDTVSEMTVDSSEIDNLITGVGCEDKLAENGETQTIAAMILQAMYVGIQAILNRKIFGKVVMYGYVRVIQGDKNVVWPYKLSMDFVKRECIICRGEQHMEIQQFMHIVKDLLETHERLSSD